MIPLSYNLRSLTVRKATTLATVIGIALVVFVFAAVLMLNAGIKDMLGRSGRADHAIILRQGSDAELSSSFEMGLVNNLRSKPELAQVKTNLVGELIVVATMEKAGASGISNVQLRGVTDDVYQFRPEAKIIAGRKAQPGTDEVVIGKDLRGQFKNLDLGGSVEVKKNRSVKVVGVFEAGGSSFQSEVWADADTVRATFGRPGLVSSIRAHLASPEGFDAFKTDVESDKTLGLKVVRESDYYEKQSSGLNALVIYLGIFIAVLCGLGAAIGAAITMFAAVAYRQREIGTLRALGFSRFSILLSFLVESLALALFGGTIGALVSLAMGAVKAPLLNQTTWSQMVISFHVTPGTIIGALVFAAFMGLVGGFFPAFRACRVSPVQAMRG
jgi:putative ABC transport system permease protein